MREIIFSEKLHESVEELGGFWVVDRALDMIIDGLALNPYGFHRFENDFCSFRYAVTSRIGDVPPLVFVFSIDHKKNVVIEDVFRHEAY